MDSNYMPLWKVLDAPLMSLDESHVELFSLLAMFLLTLLAMLARRHRQWVRHMVQVVSILIFFYLVYSCLGVFGMIRNTAYGVTLIGTIYTESFFWISLPLSVIAFTITTGPYFCGWICPTGAFQEASASIGKLIRRLFGRDKGLRSAKLPIWGLVLLGLWFATFIGMVFYLGTTKRFYVEDSSLYWGASLILLVFMVMTRAVDDQAIRALRGISFTIIFGSTLLKTAIISPVHFAFADVQDPASALTTLVLVVASMFISRAWCRYVCPWGWFMGRLHKISRLRILPKGSCIGCGACEDVCDVDAVQAGDIKVEQCQFCMACVDRCPKGNLEVVDVWERRDEE